MWVNSVSGDVAASASNGKPKCFHHLEDPIQWFAQNNLMCLVSDITQTAQAETAQQM